MADVHTDRDGLLCPRIPVPDVEVCAADGCFVNLYENIVRADFGHRNFHQFESLISFGLDKRFHGRRVYAFHAKLTSPILLIIDMSR